MFIGHAGTVQLQLASGVVKSASVIVGATFVRFNNISIVLLYVTPPETLEQSNVTVYMSVELLTTADEVPYQKYVDGLVETIKVSFVTIVLNCSYFYITSCRNIHMHNCMLELFELKSQCPIVANSVSEF